MEPMNSFRSLVQAAYGLRTRLANIGGITFGGKRDLYRAFGYQRELFPRDYRSRYDRNEVANRIVKALPQATWRGGCDIVEDEDPKTVTPFEQVFIDIDRRLKLWDMVRRADILAGLGRYSILLLGAPGELNEPLVTCAPEDLVYLQPYGEEDAVIDLFDIDSKSPRFGKPVFYQIKRTSAQTAGAISQNLGKRVHWTRVIHLSDGLLDDSVYGEPRLKCVWNRLDDLDKLAGGGSEAFFKRADGGTQFDLDPELDFKPEQKAALQTRIDQFEHGFQRYLLTRGVTMNREGSDVADFKNQVESIIGLICAGTGIPQRVLTGSEQGKLAAKQDAANWDNRVTDRQNDYAGPMVARVVVDRFIELGIAPEPKDGAGAYETQFSSIATMDDEQRAEMASRWASLNRNGKIVVTVDEIRTRVLELPPLGEVDPAAEAQNNAPPEPKQPFGRSARAAEKGGASWKKVHQAADRFRPASKADRLRELRTRPRSRQPEPVARSAEGQGRTGRSDAGQRSY
jgi:hypothetical protein